ncbi:glycosyltransferase, partial [bacterium]|nr:glycosyltransferase [bacterium]
MRPLDVLYLIDGLGAGGAQRQLVTLARAADRDRVVPEVALYHAKHHFVSALTDAGIPVHQLGVRGGRDPRVLWRLRGLIRRRGYDVVHSFLTRPGVITRLATLGTRRPCIVVSERSVRLGTSWPSKTAERLLASRADAMVVNARAISEHVEQCVPAWRGRTTIIPNGIEWSAPTNDDAAAAERFREEHLLLGKDFLLAVIARLAEPKNPMLLLDAVALLPHSVRDRVSVVWVGACRDRSFGDRIRRRADELGLRETVRFLEPIRDIRRVYLAADAVVLPSDWEGFPNAVMEALAHGRPVIATRVGDVRELVKDGVTGWTLEPGD